MLPHGQSGFAGKKLPWITTELKNRMHERDIAKLKAILSKKPLDWANVKEFATGRTVILRSKKEFYYKNLFNQHKNDSPRSYQQTINKLTSCNTNTSSVKELIVNDISITTPSDISNAFNEHFSTIVPKLASEITSSANGHNSCLEYLNIADKI